MGNAASALTVGMSNRETGARMSELDEKVKSLGDEAREEADRIESEKRSHKCRSRQLANSKRPLALEQEHPFRTRSIFGRREGLHRAGDSIIAGCSRGAGCGDLWMTVRDV
ncbi:unnamed protein product [Ectocarpus sp. 4 AP-2014]